ncbi:hypothetical protein AB205_0059510 [Aquarana catesbeiana]|uniref:Ig-like domain-containing protein n=1 Tax=Aquarana catesbeiana TaxID=8400 RepID=A0A2G9QDW4_AQUCT|nr:hypothetical protein AB205_0059510 [Aquarana catesbeiana]
MYPVISDGMYRILNIPLERQNDQPYGCISGVTFSPSLERDQGVEYICSVEHPSLEQPIEKSTGALQVTDFPSRPQVEMSVPPLRIGEEATILCAVTKYFPDAVNVTWFRKDEQSREMYPVTSDGMYRILNIPLERQNDQPYGCISCVTFSPSLERDQGVEYICRVEHPSLEQPIMRSTGALQVTGEYHIHCNKRRGKEIYFINHLFTTQTYPGSIWL